ncbi:MAG: hypothetical protein CMB64_03120 [Euryarchaeota archaeon]|nr:hypothetical protein [Euryarchaeota archaeon]|tara:strand:- start:739 stop:1248 length:510 start_codon:yes stop_codon:yes gene_type:complete
MKNDMKNDEAVSPVIATILMVAITVVLAGVLYVWASELAGNQTDAGSLNQYKAEDHPSATSDADANNDNLMRLSFTNGPDDLTWSFLTITLFDEEDGKTYKCSPGGADCNIVEETADSSWAGSEVITLAEGGSTNICGAPATESGCTLKVSMQYKGKPVAGTSGEVSVN